MSDTERVCPVPRALTFRGVRSIVMERVWEKADEMKRRGIPLMHSEFSRLLKQEWKKVKEEIVPAALEKFESCRRGQETLEEIEKRKVEAQARLVLVGQEKKES